MLQEHLRTLGFTDKEQKIYLLVLKHKRIAPTELARLSRINRTTVYAIAKSLIAKGIIAEDLAGKSMRLVPVPAEELKNIIHKEERELKLREKSIEKLIDYLSLAQVGAEYITPKIRFVEDADIEGFLRTHFKKWVESLQSRGEQWWGFQDHSFVENYHEWIDWSWKNTPKKLELKLLSNKSAIENRLQGKYPKRYIKFWDRAMNFTATTWIMGDYLILIATNKKPFYLLEIQDELMAHNQREIFKNLWNLIPSSTKAR